MTALRGARPGRIRIIGGSLRNSRLDVPDLPGLRPTPERVRETLFNWLAPIIEGARCLDLCAGTGALGMEALSRGSASVHFVEPDARTAQALRQNLERLKVNSGRADTGQVMAIDAQSFLNSSPQPMDIVFLDPPFALDLWSDLAKQLEQRGWLTSGATIYVECRRATVLVLPSSWRLHREGFAGEVRFAIYRRA